mmetsp:Transcript_20904/g.44063  ORF Transcript_20904/g.44063 Transcript_20904/m.44063 type:complete len:292 (-) Transcript_20904:1603-2478(-)
MATEKSEPNTLLINYNWHHAVNDQPKLDAVLHHLEKNDESKEDKTKLIEAIEADIIFSDIKSRAVMGHPPAVDGDLTLRSFLKQLHDAKFQHGHGNGNGDGEQSSMCPVLKLDFKSMTALQSSLVDVQSYLNDLPSHLHKRVWINADILPGPGEDLNDEMAQIKMTPRFDAAEFLRVVTSQFFSAVLSIGWTTSLTDIHAVYTEKMVDEMIRCAEPYSEVTFPVRASCFRKSWEALRTLYCANDQWTVTLWWSLELPREQLTWIYNTLEKNEELANRTYYDLVGFRECLSD